MTLSPTEKQAAIDFVMKTLGTPYDHDNHGPLAYGCWGYARHTQKELFNRDYPEIHMADSSTSTFIRTIAQHRKELNLTTIERPVHGCLVELSHSSHPHHIGTWLDLNGGGIAHCIEGAGVVFDTLLALKASGWRRFVYDAPNS